MKKILLILLLIAGTLKSQTTCSLTTSSNWNVASSWSCGHIPLCSDNIYIPNGYTVTISTSIDLNGSGCNLTNMTISGVIFFDGNTSKLSLPPTATVNLTSTGKIITNVNNNSQKFTIGSNTVWNSNNGSITGPSVVTSQGGQLPIELIEFTGAPIMEGNNISWVTVTEINNDYFVVEKSKDAINFEVLGIESGAGNSSTLLNYSLIDTNPYEITYYRLKQVDFDGKLAYSNIISVTKSKEHIIVIRTINMIGQEVSNNFEGLRVIFYSNGTVIKKSGK